MEVKEKGWRDIRRAYVAAVALSALDVGGWLSDKLDACAAQDDTPQSKYGRKDAIRAALARPARETQRWRSLMTEEFGVALSITGALAGIGTGLLATGAAWALAVGKGVVAAGAIGMATGLVTAPLVACAIGVGISIGLPMLAASALYWPSMLSDGLRIAGLRRRNAGNPSKKKAAPAAKHPPLTGQLESHLRIIGSEDSAARVDFFRSLRKRFPEEFNEAATLDVHDPVLRGPVAVKRPLKFRPPAKTAGTEGGGS